MQITTCFHVVLGNLLTKKAAKPTNIASLYRTTRVALREIERIRHTTKIALTQQECFAFLPRGQSAPQGLATLPKKSVAPDVKTRPKEVRPSNTSE